jgi:hypothetical protein
VSAFARWIAGTLSAALARPALIRVLRCIESPSVQGSAA